MAFRGRGFGRGGGGRRGNYGTPEPFILFPMSKLKLPEDVTLPDINDVKEERALVIANNKLQLYWKTSPYYLEKPTKRKSEENDILIETKQTVELNWIVGKKKVEYNQSKGFSHQKKDQMKFDKFEFYENLERKSE
ncbi:hypothetical protein MKW98_029307, partial [Papaver atlanticum]